MFFLLFVSLSVVILKSFIQPNPLTCTNCKTRDILCIKVGHGIFKCYNCVAGKKGCTFTTSLELRREADQAEDLARVSTSRMFGFYFLFGLS